MSDSRTLPFLALRPLDLRLPSASSTMKLAKHALTESVVGETGHLERANAWTHLIAAAMFAIYAFVRPWVFNMHSLTAQLSEIAVVMSALTFAVSATYYVYSPVRGCAPIMHDFNYLAIYAAIATAAVADTSLVTKAFVGVPFQTIADPLLAATIAGGYFTIRRIMVPPDKPFRRFHSDLEHAPLRRVASWSLVFVWIMIVPPAFNNLTIEAAGVWLGWVLTASVLLGVWVRDHRGLSIAGPFTALPLERQWSRRQHQQYGQRQDLSGHLHVHVLRVR